MLSTLENLFNLARERKKSPVDGSYTNKLLNDKTLSKEKVLEEINELIEAVENNSNNDWNVPKGAMISTSDPYREQSDINKTGSMDLGVMYAMAENYTEDPDYKNYHLSTFNQGISMQNQVDENGQSVTSISLDDNNNSWRSSDASSENQWSGYLNGLLNIDDKYPQLIAPNLNFLQVQNFYLEARI